MFHANKIAFYLINAKYFQIFFYENIVLLKAQNRSINIKQKAFQKGICENNIYQEQRTLFLILETLRNIGLGHVTTNSCEKKEQFQTQAII